MVKHKHTNRLIHASSPYLLQHAHNPVDWWEWCDEAFEKAKREDKLVLVSIGYSACHWCHVMERECFEKEDTAALMNEFFVCIKVDREERPDVDQVYMDAVQLLTGQGGWPLNCFTLPDGRPIHGGTYFPKVNWETILEQLADFYKHSKHQALDYATDLVNGIKQMDIIQTEENDLIWDFEKTVSVLNNCKNTFDLINGGFNRAPKFPLPNNWEMFMLLNHYTKDESMFNAVHTTLQKMANGGIYDQVGGGFARYSTDSFWIAPHFEKMLYDNGQLMSLYAHGYQQTKNALYIRVVEQTHDFLSRELTSVDGTFYSALDADSEGVEGKYYVWTHDELIKLLGEDEPIFSLYFSVEATGNWEHGNNILYKTKSDEELEKLTGKSISEIENIVERCNKILLQERTKRVHPGLDDKIITCWNALMIKGYADAYLAFGDENFLNAATTCADFILNTMFVDEILYRIHKNGKTTIPAFAEDYANLCEALISLYETNGVEKYLWKAKELMENAIQYFYDEESKFFFFKSKNDSPLIASKIDVQDNVISSSNSVFAKCLFVLGFLFDENKYEQMAKEMLIKVQPKFEVYPTGYSNWIQLQMLIQKGFYQVVVTGKNIEKEMRELRNMYLPNAIIFGLTTASTIPLFNDKQILDETKIYVCKDKTCGLPQTNIEKVIRLMKE